MSSHVVCRLTLHVSGNILYEAESVIAKSKKSKCEIMRCVRVSRRVLTHDIAVRGYVICTI